MGCVGATYLGSQLGSLIAGDPSPAGVERMSTKEPASEASSLLKRIRARIEPGGGPAILAVGIASLLLVGGLALATDQAAEPVAIGDGDRVTYHVSAYTEDGTLVYTTNGSTADEALRDDNADLDPKANLSEVRPRQGTVNFSKLADRANQGESFQLSRFVIGNHEGDIVRTPLIHAPFGTTETYRIPTTFGPMDKRFTVNLTTVDQASNESAGQGPDVRAEDYRPGARLPYAGFLEIQVLDVTADQASVELLASSGDRFHSDILGINFTVEEHGGDQVLLHADVREGETFLTGGCQLPLDDLPRGRYRVVDIQDDRFLVETAPLYNEHLLDRTLQFEVEILQVEPTDDAGGLLTQIMPG